MSRARQMAEQGMGLHQQGRLREATALYQQALALEPGYGLALHYLGLCMAQQGMADMARVMLQKALAAGENTAALHDHLAQMLQGAGKLQEALVHRQRASALAPGDLAYGQALAALYQRLGDLPGARQARLQLLQRHPDHTQTLMALALAAYDRDDAAEAMDYYRAACAAEPCLREQTYMGFASPPATVAVGDPYPLLQLGGTAEAEQVRTVLRDADLHVLDDFLPDPDAARAWAAGLQYGVARGNYPGSQTGPLPCEAIMQALAERLGRRLKWLSPDNGVMRLTLADATARTDIHVDDELATETRHYAAVLYLTRPEHCQGGTSFWRHAATGWLRRPEDALLRAAGYADFKTFLRRETPLGEPRAFAGFTAQRDRWQQLFTVPMRYNRLVLYKGNHFHAVDNVFGDSFDNGRLTRLFSFEMP